VLCALVWVTLLQHPSGREHLHWFVVCRVGKQLWQFQGVVHSRGSPSTSRRQQQQLRLRDGDLPSLHSQMEICPACTLKRKSARPPLSTGELPSLSCMC
jgi:hypothetical protein